MGEFTMGSGKAFEPLPEDKYQVEIYAAETFMGTKFQSSEQELRLKVTMVILDEDKKVLEEGEEVPVRGRRVWSRVGTKFSPPGSKKPTNLTLLVAAALGHEVTDAEANSFAKEDLLGKQLCVMVNAKPGPDGTIWNNVISYSKATKQLTKYDDSEFAERGKAIVEKSQPAVPDTGDFVADMDKLSAEKKEKAK